MDFAKKEIICILLILFTFSCDRITRESGNVVESHHMSDIENIVWTLESLEIGVQPIDLSSYAPFHLIYGDSSFSGDDGCNRYGGIYHTKCDTVVPARVTATEMACSNINSFSWQHLTAPYRYQILLVNGELMLHRSDSIYTYRSGFLEDVDSSLVDKSWSLTSNVLVTLALDDNRGFQAGYDCDDSDNAGCGTIGGIYGIGDNNTILFYKTRSGGSGLQWYRYLMRILSSSSYSIEDDLLIFSNEGDSVTFEFSVTD